MILEFIKKWALNESLSEVDERSCKLLERAILNFLDKKYEEVIKKR